MNILAIDSITPTLSVSASGPKGKVTLSVNGTSQHAENMIPLIERAIELAGFGARETAIVACAEGPGSFTGLRLAYSAAKAIQLASDCKLVPVPSLFLYAKGTERWPGVVISVIDAKKQRYYAQFFRRGEAVSGSLDLSVAEAPGYVDPAERILVTGPDAILFADELSGIIPGADITPIPSGLDGIASTMISVAENMNHGYTEPVPDHSGPVYVRKSDAESNVP